MPADSPDPLAQPTRARVYARLRAARGPARSEAIAAAIGIHPNSARAHLQALADAGLVLRNLVPSGSGRPHFEWSLAPGGRPRGTAPTAYQDLAGWLARALGPGRSERQIERAGAAIGRDIAPRPGRSQAPAQVLEAALSSMGFAPQANTAGAAATFRLLNCPYRTAAAEDPGTVCTLHRGITRGLVETLAPGARLADFVAEDPAVAGCRVEVTGLPPA